MFVYVKSATACGIAPASRGFVEKTAARGGVSAGAAWDSYGTAESVRVTHAWGSGEAVRRHDTQSAGKAKPCRVCSTLHGAGYTLG